MYEHTFAVPEGDEERVTSLLTESGTTSFWFETADGSGANLSLKIFSETPETPAAFLHLPGHRCRELPDSEWKNRWAADYSGHELTTDIYIMPPDTPLPDKPYERIIYIDPEDAFGDGHHPTTRLCGEMLVDVITSLDNPENCSMIDIGTGSGILAIVASLYGIGDVELFDYDTESVVKAELNASLNGIDSLKPFQSDIYTFRSVRTFNVVMANLLSRIIEENIMKLKSLVSTGGVLIVSGISEIWRSQMRELFKDSGFDIVEETLLEGWTGFILKIAEK